MPGVRHEEWSHERSEAHEVMLPAAGWTTIGKRARTILRSMPSAALAGALALALSACGPKTRALEENSKAPPGPRAASNQGFTPKPGDFSSLESFAVATMQMPDAVKIMQEVVVPRIRARGGLRAVWILRNDASERIDIVSIWAEQMQFQQWLMSSDRLEAYQALGPVLAEQPIAQPQVLLDAIMPPPAK